jgi:hypothetical protein
MGVGAYEDKKTGDAVKAKGYIEPVEVEKEEKPKKPAGKRGRPAVKKADAVEEPAVEKSPEDFEAIDVPEFDGTTQKQLDDVKATMKKLAKQYKEGNKSVVADLKDLTVKKKELEAQLEDEVGSLQEDVSGGIDPEVQEVAEKLAAEIHKLDTVTHGIKDADDYKERYRMVLGNVNKYAAELKALTNEKGGVEDNNLQESKTLKKNLLVERFQKIANINTSLLKEDIDPDDIEFLEDELMEDFIDETQLYKDPEVIKALHEYNNAESIVLGKIKKAIDKTGLLGKDPEWEEFKVSDASVAGIEGLKDALKYLEIRINGV